MAPDADKVGACVEPICVFKTHAAYTHPKARTQSLHSIIGRHSYDSPLMAPIFERLTSPEIRLKDQGPRDASQRIAMALGKLLLQRLMMRRVQGGKKRPAWLRQRSSYAGVKASRDIGRHNHLNTAKEGAAKNQGPY